ncbi:hypothetical protein QTL95_26935 [Rhizobium sp. S152]|uniref:hypothetical protein n=1 Tax=Rhizobium sp. S152 TaxID=3055038 RepID=UPI0025AA2859|nr:hypothetical protein [Rhizobium sp. S152]MDM9629524.1 hypothetical protein [Rhizobium sp. S152]
MTEARSHLDDHAVTAAAEWVADNEPRPDVIPAIKDRYGLSALQAAEACALAQKIRVARRADI